MRAGFFQFEPRLGDARYNARIIRRALERERFDLVVLPELSSTGYLLASRERALEWAEPIEGGETVRTLIEIAGRSEGLLIAGIAERDGDRVYNTAVIVGAQGVLHRHRKVHLPRYELPIFDRGERFEVFRTPHASIGIAMCFDSWMPEACRRLSAGGAEILASPANFGGPWTADIARVRALENVMFVISANRIGVEEANGVSATFRGGSQIIGCDGDVLFQAGKEECVALVEISPERARSKHNILCDDLMRELEFYGPRQAGSAAG